MKVKFERTIRAVRISTASAIRLTAGWSRLLQEH
nr:MAG TPA_asm: hypothetical protein [Caudoviricetes sp.]